MLPDSTTAADAPAEAPDPLLELLEAIRCHFASIGDPIDFDAPIPALEDR